MQTYYGAGSWTALIGDLKLLFAFQASKILCQLQVLHIYCLPIFTTAFPFKAVTKR